MPICRLATVAILLALAGCAPASPPAAAVPAAVETDPPAASPVAEAASPAPDLDAVKRFRSTRAVDEVAPPVAVRIPRIDVRSELEELGRAEDGTIEVPSAWERAGWYAQGPRPGQRGPAVILGHVDSKSGPAVFYRLEQLHPGDEILVDRSDGTTAVFTVTGLERHDKDEFPSEAVYFPTLEPVLRLVTCGGVFDRSTGHYRDNVIVFAELTGSPA